MRVILRDLRCERCAGKASSAFGDSWTVLGFVRARLSDVLGPGRSSLLLVDGQA